MKTQPNILLRKLELFGRLPSEDQQLLNTVVSCSRELGPRQTVIREGDSPSDVHLVIDGFACRSKTLEDGGRQILAYLVPGDFCDLNVFILKAMDHDIETLSACTMVDIPRSTIVEMCARPTLARALWWATLVDEATLREWIVNLGQRDAEQRLGHLFCEIHLRLASVGLASNGRCEFPVTQTELAETTGLSAVHVNRSIQSLRAKGMIEFKSACLNIINLRDLRELSSFNPNYLHLDDADDSAQSFRAV